MVLKYPAVCISTITSPPFTSAILNIKCFTNVVSDGAKRKAVPLQHWSLSAPTLSVIA